jgi:VWFA-related protein
MRHRAVRKRVIRGPAVCALFACCAALLGVAGASSPSPRKKPKQAAQAPAQQGPTVRSEVNLVPVYFTVRDDKRALIANLPREQFRVFEDSREQPIDAFGHESDVPLSLGVVLDTSTRLSTLLSAEADAANMFLAQVVRPTDLAFVLSFDARVNILQEPSQQLDALERSVFSIMKGARFGESGNLGDIGPTATGVPQPAIPSRAMPNREAHMFDAVGVGAHRYLAHEVGRKAIVILALADDAHSETTMEQALRALQETNVIAYVLEFSHAGNDDCDVLHIFNTESPHNAGRLAEETGGRVIKVKGRDKLRAAFAEIAEELHSQYYLGYYMPNPARDSRFHRIEVKARDRRYRIQARRGYYATPPVAEQ